jgi:hypothetical protein
MASLRGTMFSSWTQYFVVLRTKAFWLPPADESPSIG